MDGLVKDTRKSWNDTRNVLTPLADNYEAEFNKELSLLKSKCLEAINKYVDVEVSHLLKVTASERSHIIESFRKHFSNFDLHENRLFSNFNREIQEAINEFNRCRVISSTQRTTSTHAPLPPAGLGALRSRTTFRSS